jgi:hypothetical protein
MNLAPYVLAIALTWVGLHYLTKLGVPGWARSAIYLAAVLAIMAAMQFEVFG